jgi:hypothetical protein
MKRIDFCVIGVQKSASTWLHNCLNEHPDIFIGGGKNEDNYYKGRLYTEKGEEWFWSLFEGYKDQKIVGNSSVDYIYDYKALSALKNQFKDVKLILVLRDPMARTGSAYNWLFRQNLIPNLELQEAINQSAEMQLRDSAPNESQQQLYEIVDRSLYYKQLLQLEKLDLLSNLHIIFYEDISSKPKTIVKQLFEYLQVNEFVPLNLHRRPKSTSKLEFLNKIQRKTDSKLLNKALSAISELSGKFFGSKQESVTIENESLKALFKEDLIKLKSLLKEHNLLSNSASLHLDSWISSYN